MSYRDIWRIYIQGPDPPGWGALNESVKYGLSFAKLGPESDYFSRAQNQLYINYRLILSSQWAPHFRKFTIVRQKKKSGHGLQM
jgi:hypothetical protein